MIKDLSVDCGTIRVRNPYVITPQPKPSPLFILGLASIFGLALLNREKYIPLTTGKLGGNIVYANK